MWFLQYAVRQIPKIIQFSLIRYKSYIVHCGGIVVSTLQRTEFLK